MKYDAVGINIYGGGFTLGAMRVFNVLGQWEEITLGKDTFDLNFGDSIPRPLSMSEWPVKKFLGVPYVYANPPCAPWSSANTRKGYTAEKRFLDARLQLTRHTMETAMRILPDVFISESVENAYNIGCSHYDQYIDRWRRRGYSVTFFLTDAIIHGLPSMRRRFHFIAHKYELDLTQPDMSSFKPTTVRKTIGNIQGKIGKLPQHTFVPPTRSYIKIMSHTPKGGRARETERTWPGYTGPYSSFLVKRLMWDAPAFTMVGLSKLIHPDGRRLLTWREGLRLMSFPDTFIAKREIEAADSVTPLMGEYLSNIARRAIDNGVRVKHPTHTVIDWRPLGNVYHISVLKYMEGLE